MDSNIIEKNNQIIIKNMMDFEPKHIFECGQAFRWHVEEDDSYTAIHKSKVINVKRDGKDIIFSNTNMEDFENIWYDYFDLGRDYGEIKKELSKDPILNEAIKFGEGIRILNQEPYETTISFIISANNQIPRIKRSIELISQKYGESIGSYNGKEYFSFPSSEILASIDEKELEDNCKVGYRAKYIVNTSKMIKNKEIDLDKLFQLPTETAKEILMRLPGVGPKVSNCILLFSLNKNEAFPVDVWVKRIMESLYFKENTSTKKISAYAEENFGSLGGFAQQYLFYYARELGIGKKK
ncbi:DNA-3-methyladenine glycosylase family protein [Schnuerera ultunensis]|uniref:DNA-3-methyladenine glycosylase family protein n=1 Tax=Schnuerera ultunensis TaxID=45497 RepID=UPI00040F6B82|nr:DNA-3-methyladenine glycosylase [Schnuerera ultunensis]